MIIDCIADLHGYYPELEGGDLLIVAGDLTASEAGFQYVNFFFWLAQQNYKKKIFIAGNHDNKIQQGQIASGDFEYLCDSATEFEGLKIWGSPWTLTFPGMNPHCTAFTGTEEDLEAKFKLIPDDTDILITHGPPFGILDSIGRHGIMKLIKEHEHDYLERAGSRSLWKNLHRVKPKLHVFGHIHEYGGHERHIIYLNCGFYNCSHVNEYYKPVNKPIRIEL